jgi:non-canonical purine NTP pyrophosphatase (RdgB/HAM1 family)
VFDNYNVACFADDTGLEVEALNGEPGVYSARYAGAQRNSTDNIELLLKNLRGKENLKARFRTVVTLITEKGIHISLKALLKWSITFDKQTRHARFWIRSGFCCRRLYTNPGPA